MGRRCEGHPDTIPWGWTLEVAPFVGPTADVDDSDLSLFHPDTAEHHEVDVSLYAINDLGLTADVDYFRHLKMEEALLLTRQQQLEKEERACRDRISATRQRLVAAKARSRVHPYVAENAPVPHPDLPHLRRQRYPNSDLDHGWITIRDTLGREELGMQRWLPLPVLYDDLQGSTAVRWVHLPKCFYCHSVFHEPRQCLRPHALCSYRQSCLVPNNHSAYLGGCPYNHLHSRTTHVVKYPTCNGH